MIEKTSAGMNQGMINKLVTVLETTLSKLSRYDEGSLIGSILSFTVLCFSKLVLEIICSFETIFEVYVCFFPPYLAIDCRGV